MLADLPGHLSKAYKSIPKEKKKELKQKENVVSDQWLHPWLTLVEEFKNHKESISFFKAASTKKCLFKNLIRFGNYVRKGLQHDPMVLTQVVPSCSNQTDPSFLTSHMKEIVEPIINDYGKEPSLN